MGLTSLALLAGGLVGGIQAAEAATIPDNPCVTPPRPPVAGNPVLTRVRMSTSVVDVRRRAKNVVITLKARDTVALSRVTVSVPRYRTGSFDLRASATRVSGTATDGTWRAVVAVPRFIPQGLYRLAQVRLWNVTGGYSLYNPRKLAPGAWPAPFRVLSRTDRIAPTVTGFRVSTRSVDTRTSAQTITVRVDARDNLSGVAKVSVTAYGIDTTLVPALSAYQGVGGNLTRSPTRKNRWIGRFVVPTWVGVSTWDFSLLVKDKRRHLRYVTTKDLARRGWQSTLRVTSGRDAVAPTLAALSFTPTSVDARNGAARVDVTYRVTDALSGPSRQSGITFGGVGVVVTSVSGTANDRTYRGYVLVPQCGSSTQSTLRAEADLADVAGNERWPTADELAALGFPTDLSVRQRDAQAPSVDYTAVSVGGPLALRFSEPVIMAGPLAATLRVTVNGVAAPGAWECRNGSGSVVVCDADGAAVVTASFSPSAAFAAGDHLELEPTAAPPAPIGIYDLDGVPLTEIDVGADL